MENILLDTMKELDNVTLTENGGVTYKSTMNGLADLFALGGSYRNRSDADCILLFDKAFKEDEVYALKCLFYLRDVRGGQGERRFFRVITKWLARTHTDAMRRNLEHVCEYGRWDDLYVFEGTPLEKEAFDIMYHQLALDVECKTPSLLAKWLKSENTSSVESRRLATKTRKAFGMTSRQYRKTLSVLRTRINVLERLMSAGRWDEIEFDKIPSKAGLIYRNAFAKHDLERVASEKKVQTYEQFAKSETTKVNAKTLNPCEVVSEARKVWYKDLYNTDRLMVNKYWANLADYFNGAVFDGVAVVDTSGSMTGWGYEKGIRPIDVAISLGMYCAENCSVDSPWHGHFISFSRCPRLMKVEGADFVEKAKSIYDKAIVDNTNIKAVFDLMLRTARVNAVKPNEMVKNIIVISDMEFDYCSDSSKNVIASEMEKIAMEWAQYGYELPRLVFWNVDARNDTIAMKDNGRVTFVSGYSPITFEMIMLGKSGLDLIYDKLNSERYSCIK